MAGEPKEEDMGLWKGVDVRSDISQRLIQLLEAFGIDGARVTTKINDQAYIESQDERSLRMFEPEAIEGALESRFRSWVAWHDMYLWTRVWFDLEPEPARDMFLADEAQGMARLLHKIEARRNREAKDSLA